MAKDLEGLALKGIEMYSDTVLVRFKKAQGPVSESVEVTLPLPDVEEALRKLAQRAIKDLPA